jgi:DNA sulfur modification protein DndD
MNLNKKSELWFVRLEVENWRQYNGKHVIDFSTSQKKHLTVVHAENSVGKTTMLNAIKWCLYGETPEFSDKKNLVTDRSEKDTCKVRLRFKYGQKEYSAYRVYDQRTFTSKLTLSTIKENSSHHDPVQNPEVVINNILPSELSNYFLFAGERYSKALGEDNNVSHIRAIRDILGFTMSEDVIDDIEYLRRKKNKELSSILERDEETRALAKNLKRLEKEKKDFAELKTLFQESYQEQKEIFDTNSKLISASSHSTAKKLGHEQDDKTRLLRTAEGHKLDYLKRRQKLVSTYGWILFGSKLTKKNFDHIKVNHGEMPSPHRENVISKIIKKQECICTTPILPGSKERKALEKLMSEASNELIDNRVLDAISQGDFFRKRSKDFFTDLKEIELDLHKFETEISELEKKLKSIKLEIDAIGNHDISGFQKKRDNAQAEMRKIDIKNGENNRDIESNLSSIRSIETQIRQSTTNTSKTTQLQNFVELSDKLIKRLKITHEKHEAHSIKAIRDLVQKNVDESLRKNKEVLLTDGYKFELRDRETGLIDYGADGGNGQTLLSNLSFISALISTSKDRAKVNEKSIFIPGTIAPFVIDAPFAEMDSSYRLNTFDFLPKQSHQLILFLSSGQWDDKFEEKIGRYIGKRYLLINHDRTNNFENNEITIKNKAYQLNRLGNSDDKNFSASTIEEMKI